MNLLIVGAAGRTGRHVVDQALAAGHHVTTYVRRPDALERRDERLRVVAGDVLDIDSVRAAMAGQDAVISTLGSTGGNRPPRSRQEWRTSSPR
jgi:uncharacterized protein YbjT (DUF2867 family)